MPASEGNPRRGLYSIEELDREQILALLDRAEVLRTQRPFPDALKGKIVGLLFFQPSTRTRFGFHAATVRLGGAAIELNATKYQADMEQPESIEDTIRVISAYCDILVIRHGEAAAVKTAFEVSSVPVINAGAGQESHPTQALIDLFAIRRKFGHLDGLRIGIAGDLAGSRAAKSLVSALRHFPPRELRLMAPLGREMPERHLAGQAGAGIDLSHELDVRGLDVLYMAGCPGGGGRASVRKSALALRRPQVRGFGPQTVVLCPLPRVDEVAVEMDIFPQAAYFDQSADGMYIRMAILVRLMPDGPMNGKSM
jgi:aspartate carbamoyltransferase catalytic subunit